MKIKTSLLIVLLIFICCMGVASATEDINNDTVTTENDDVVFEQVGDINLQIDDSEDENLESNIGGDQTISNQDVLETGPSSEIYVNASSTNPVTGRKSSSTTGIDWNTAYGTEKCLNMAVDNIENGGKIIVANGEYTVKPDYDMSILEQYAKGWTIEGFGDNVIFSFEGTYNLDSGSNARYGQKTNDKYAVNNNITHKNIIFDCDVKVGSKNFKFVDCTFNKGVEISHDYVSDDICNITFENCIFANPKSDIVVADKNNVVYNECTFLVTAVNTNITIFSNENGIVIINLTDIDGNPIKGANVTYNTTNDVKGFNLTDDEGKIIITGLIGEFTINVNYLGNESYKQVNLSKSFNFKSQSKVNITSTKWGIIDIKVLDEENTIIKNSDVKYTIGGVNTTNNTGADGILSISVSGEGEIKVYFNGNDIYLLSNASYTYNFTSITTKISITNQSNVIIVNLTDNNGNPIKGATLNYTTNTIKGSNITDTNGLITITGLVGSFELNVTYEGNESYNKANATKSFDFSTPVVEVIESKLTITNESDVIVVNLTDVNGNPIKGATVNYTTNAIKGSNVTDVNGLIRISGLSGEFTINVTYAGNESYKKVNATKSFNFKTPAVVTKVSINSTQKGIVVIKVVDDKNNPISNLEVKYSVNGVNSTNKTSSDGTFAVQLMGEGEIKAFVEDSDSYVKSNASYKYNFTQTSNTTTNITTQTPATTTPATTQPTTAVSKVASKITAKKATFKAKTKTKKYAIALKATKAISKAKVTIKIAGKTYKATTNSKGKATFKITKLTKKGKYTAVIKYAGNSKYTASSKSVKITVKK